MKFIFKNAGYFIVIFLLFIIISSCNKNDIAPNENVRGGIALTFDDNYINNWYSYINLFDSFGVKATFFISNYNKLTPDQIIKLKALRDHGHEIAFHSTNHPNFLKYVDTAGINNLFEREIKKGLRLMNKDGFYPTTFAYPYGSHNDIIDKLLLTQFKSIRALNGTHDLARSLAPLRDNKLIFGLGIDESSKRRLSKIEGLLYLAKETNTCSVLLIHNIERSTTRFQIPLWKLRKILIRAKSLSLKFYTISEISK